VDCRRATASESSSTTGRNDHDVRTGTARFVRRSCGHSYTWPVGASGTPPLNGKPLYDNYEMHFMITQGIRDRKTLRVSYPMANKKQPAGEVNPATQQIDFYIRSPQQNPKNKPNREEFMHFFGMEVTWK
jgi:hypothetical protein